MASTPSGPNPAPPSDFKKPPFDSLPLDKNGPRGNAWGLFGPNDQLGMLNLLTPSATLAAAQEIKFGIRISTDAPLDRLQTPLFNRQPFHHEIKHNLGGRTVNDDVLTFNTQSSTQWDGFRHYGYQDEKLYFNNHTQDDYRNTTINGIHTWASAGGIVGRGVLLDYHAWATAQNIAHAAHGPSSKAIPLSELLAVAAHQNTAFQPGDMLFVRTGYGAATHRLAAADLAALAAANPPAIGVAQSEELLRWLWDRDFAAVAGDQPAWEAWPCRDRSWWHHEWLLAGWGMPIGELFELERLAEECARVGRWSFWFASCPLMVPGGVASPPNGVAVL